MPVSRDEMVKGYEFAKDQYVTFTPEELKTMEEAGTQTADINEFVPIAAIDPVYFDSSYYLHPDGPIAVEALRVIQYDLE